MVYSQLQNIIMLQNPNAIFAFGRKSMADIAGGEVLPNVPYFFLDIESSGSGKITKNLRQSETERLTLICVFKDNTDFTDTERGDYIAMAQGKLRFALRRFFVEVQNTVQGSELTYSSVPLLNYFSGYFVGHSVSFQITTEVTDKVCNAAQFVGTLSGDAETIINEPYSLTIEIERTDFFLDASGKYTLELNWGDGTIEKLSGTLAPLAGATIERVHTFATSGAKTIEVSGAFVGSLAVEVMGTPYVLTESADFMVQENGYKLIIEM